MKKEVHLILMTAANADIGLFQDPTPYGAFFSYERAKARFEEIIAKEKERLNPRYDAEECADGLWSMYEDGSAAACFVRIEILSSEIEDDENAERTGGFE